MNEKVLHLKGHELRCIEVMPVGLLFDIAEALEGGGSGMQAVAALSRAIRTMVVDDQRDELKAVLLSTSDPVTFDELNEALGTLMKAYGKRPTAPSSASRGGGRPIGGTSRVVSLWRGSSAQPAPAPAQARRSRGGRSRAS